MYSRLESIEHEDLKVLQRYSQSRQPHGSEPFLDWTGTIPENLLISCVRDQDVTTAPARHM